VINHYINRKTISLLIVFSLIAFVLLFNPDTDSRTIKELLNYGHVLVFGLIALLTYRVIGSFKISLNRRLAAWLITIVLGFMVEMVQLSMKGRYFELGDLLNDGIGALAFLVFFSEYEKHHTAWIMRIISVVLVLVAGIPFYVALTNECNYRLHFPVISSFENILESSSWVVDDAEIKRSKEHAAKGLYSGIVTFLPGKYSTLCNEDLIENWAGYRIVAMDIYFPGEKGLKITVRINDRTHNQNYNDRYNQRVELEPGWNHISIKLKNIEKSPANRLMDMSTITRICIFASGLTEPQVVYLDNLRLE
jgi:VanZ family protein